MRNIGHIVFAIVVLTGCGSKGGGGNASVDAGVDQPTEDGGYSCNLQTCASAGATCGPIGDGCGAILDCGGCTAPETCGGGGTHFTCGGGNPNCTARTCADAGAECGVISDGCGGLTANCGTCPTGETCGGAGVANKCGAPPCMGLCLQQDACTNMAKTTITGVITAPGHDDVMTWGTPDPLYGALVYVPNGSAGPPTYGVMPFTPGVACESCSSLVTGDPLVSATTTADGRFTLTNAPCGTNIPLVIQLGRWRRQITIPAVACCANNTLTNAQTHLPRTQVGEPGDVRSDIPKMAFSTGSVDTLHCVLRKIGIADSEFTNPSGSGRVHFFKDNGSQISSSTPAASTLYGNPTELAKYDMVLFECVGNRVPKSATHQQYVIDYANAGGRVFATHYSYVWMTDSDGNAGTNTGPKPWSLTADWDANQGNLGTVVGVVDKTLQGDAATQSRRIAFSEWLQLVGASATAGEIPVNVARRDFNSVSSLPGTKAGTPAQQWLYRPSPNLGPLHYTFDTPIAYAPNPAPTTQCGRVLFSDFHVSDASSGGTTFPNECTAGPMTPQEKTLEFMLFDLASCVGPPLSSCTPRTCAELGVTCGPSGNGCDDGVILDCGSCNACTPRTCADANANCGVIGDGCGATIDCGPCADGTTCGGGGVPNQCGTILL